jgi:integrase
MSTRTHRQQVKGEYPPAGDITERVFTVTIKGSPNDEATFSYRDNTWHLWDILKPHELRAFGTVNFREVRPWLVEDTKRYVAYLWLQADADAMKIQKTLVAIRHLGRQLPDFKGRPIDLRMKHSWEFVRRFRSLGLGASSNVGMSVALNHFMSYVRHLHPELSGCDFRIILPKDMSKRETHKPLEQIREARIPTDVLAAIIDACAVEVEAYYSAKRDYVDGYEDRKEYRRRWELRRKAGLKRNPGYPGSHNAHFKDLLTRAIKSQAVILAICVGRRASSVCNTAVDIRTEVTEWTNEAGYIERGVMLRFREGKIKKADEDVPCPDTFGELALKAIKTTRELTADLRSHNPQWAEFLFIVPAKRRRAARVLTVRQLNEYMNGSARGGKGLRERYDIPCEKITTHNYRHTRATNAWLGGLQVHEVAYDLGHATSDMAIRHYIIGSEESKRRYEELLSHGALSGAFVDFVGGREMVRTRLSRRHVEILKTQGCTVSPNRYGYCTRLSTAECSRATLCYLGVGVTDGGCDYHLLSPDALPALEEDRVVAEAAVAEYSPDPAYRNFVMQQRNLLTVIDSKIKEAKELEARRDCGGSCGTCEHERPARFEGDSDGA